VRRFPALLLTLAIVACATPPPPKGTAKPPSGAGKPSASRPAPSARPRWEAVPARADGTPVPGGRRHIVKRGETGIAIAKAYGVPWSRIASANRLERDALLGIGQPLFIPTTPTPRPALQPGQARPKPTTPEEQAAAFSLDIDDLITGSAPATRQANAAATPAPKPATPPAGISIPRLSWPVDGRVILSSFGPKPGGRVNDGINIKTLRGATVRAAADGEVIYVGDAITGFGLMILLRHPGGAVTAYGHLEDSLVDRGARVQRGQPIARAGSSGEAREPQLLFQLRTGRRALDPLAYLPR
jgi:murein DD-endopeptidase MepM/ murein hydrolase activator NlpD